MLTFLHVNILIRRTFQSNDSHIARFALNLEPNIYIDISDTFRINKMPFVWLRAYVHRCVVLSSEGKNGLEHGIHACECE